MNSSGNTWVLILAAGEGSRLRSLTTTASGTTVPKQFCSLQGGPSLLHEALRRGASISSRTQLCAIVAAQHRRWWQPQLCALPAANVIVQPENRGTANGILWPLLHIIASDPDARVVLLPSDHHVEHEPVLAESLRQAVTQLALHPDAILLLGVEPDEPDPELGYIVPGDGDYQGSFRVAQFVEKPTPVHARRLIGEGGVWNTFILAARAQALLALFMERCPEIVAQMQAVRSHDARLAGTATALVDLYQRLPELDFSRHIMQGYEARLRVVPVQYCGWSDLGTPKRVADALRKQAQRHRATDPMSACLSLAAQHEQLQFAGSAMR